MSEAGKRRVAILLATVLAVSLTFALVGIWVVRSVVAVEERAVTAAALERQGIEPPGTAVEQTDALIAYAVDDEVPLADRNRAIWLLGRLRTEAAAEPLESLLNGRECDHERFVCQDEVLEALRRIRREDGALSWIGGLIDGNR